MSYLKKGNQLKREGKREEAIAAYKQAIELNPTFPWYYYELAEILVENNRLTEALDRYQKAIKLNPNCAAFHYGLAKSLLQKGDSGNAIEHLQKAISLKANITIYQQTLALAYETESNFEEALRIWQANAATSPQNIAAKKIHWLQTVVAENLINQGDLLSKDGRTAEAVNCYQQALGLNHQQPLPVYRFCGNGLISLGKFQEAEVAFQGMKQLYPDIPEGYHGYGRIAHLLKDFNLAIKRWEEALAKFPDNLDFLSSKGNALINLRQFDEAEAVFQRIIEKYPNYPQGYDGYARVTHPLKNWDLALKRWENAIEVLPEHFNFYWQKGNVLINLSKYQEAETFFAEMTVKFPSRHEGLLGIGVVYRRQGNRELALQKFERVIKNHPQSFVGYYESAIELKDMKLFAEAEEKFLQALEKNPNHSPTLYELGILASQNGNRELALQKFEQIAKDHPLQRINAYILASTELKRLGRIEEATEKHQQLSTVLSQATPEVRLASAIFARKQGNRELALQLFDLITQIEPKNTNAYYEAVVELWDMQRLAEAQERLQQVWKNRPWSLASSSALIQKPGLLALLLEELVKKTPDTSDEVIALARLADRILFHWQVGPAPSIPIAKDAPSLLVKLEILKGLFEQCIVSQEDCEELDFNVLNHLNLAIELLEIESQRLNSKEWVTLKLNQSAVAIKSTDNLCFESLKSSASRYVFGEDEPLEKSIIEATFKYLPQLMDEEKKYFEVAARNFANSFKLKRQQSIEIFKDFVFEPPFGISNGYIVKGYGFRISKKFVRELMDQNPSSSMQHLAQKEQDWIGDPRRFLGEIAVSKKAVSSYYPDEVVFGLTTAGYAWGDYQNYGHLLFDQIPNLILYQKLNLSCKIFVPHVTDSHWDIFSALNIPKEKILVKQNQKFKYFIVPQYKHDVELINFYRKWRDSIVANTSDIPSEYSVSHIYVSRRYAHRRRMANEVEVEELMKSMGFSIVYLERLSFKETAILMHHASVIVSPYGASFASFLLSRAYTTLIGIYPPGVRTDRQIDWHCVLGEQRFYRLSGDEIPDGWQINIDKLKKVVTKILEN